MTVRMTSGVAPAALSPWNGEPFSEPVCLYDSVDGMAFGPTFVDMREADAFVRWFEKNGRQIADSEGYLYLTGRVTDLVSYSIGKAVADKWRAFEAEHKPADCPYDGDSEGFLGDRDASDGSGAWTPQCACECHESKS